MATRSKVGFKNSDGTVNASYVHFDGYLDGVGVALHLNHNSDSKAKKLGYAKGIRSIELDSPVSYYNDMENETYESEDQFHDEVVKDFEYGYLYDPSRGWLFTSSKYGTNEFIELEDQLMYDELLPGSGDAPDMSMMENVSISKLKEVEADKKAGIDTEVGQATVEELKQRVATSKAQEALTWVDQELKQVQASVARQTIKEQMENMENIVKEGKERIEQLQLANKLTKAQFNDAIQLLKNQVATESIKASLMKAQEENTEQDTKNKIQEVLESEARISAMKSQLMLLLGSLVIVLHR